MKKIISILLCISMLLGMAAFVTAAEQTHTITFTTKDKRTTYSSTKQVWEADGLKFTNDKASSSNAIGDYFNPVRLYQGSKVTIECANMTKIVFDMTSVGGTKYVTALVNSLNSAKITGATVKQNTNDITVTFSEPTNSITFTLTAQARIKAVTVTSKVAECDGTNHEYIKNSDEDYHWTECVCGATTDKIAHVAANTEYEKFDSDNHWGICSCGALVNVTAHSFGENDDTNCVCGAQPMAKGVDKPTSGKSYLLGLYNTSKRVQYYACNVMSGDYLTTTTNIEDAAALYIEEVEDSEGEYYLYFIVNDVKTYIDLHDISTNDTVKARIQLVTNPGLTFSWNESYKTFVTTFENTVYCLGTYGDYTTFNTTDVVKYLTAENVDKTQYVGHLICTHANTTAATCTEPQKCADCGTILSAALGHTAGAAATCTTAQTCTVCQAELKAALGHTPGAAATCTTAQTCTVCQAELKAALGHTPGAAATCTTAQTCTVCQAELKAVLGHTPGAAATCTTAQTCTVCNTELNPVLGHKFENGTCSREGCDAIDPNCEHAHTKVEGTVAATCTNPGKTGTTICTDCGSVIKESVDTAALGHTPGAAATCTTAQTCTVCNAELTAALGHTEVIDAAVAATCTKTGLTEGAHCSVCNTVIIAQKVVEAKGHVAVVDAAKDATCTATGLTEGSHCSVCNTVIVAQQTVPVKAHSFANGKCTVCQAADPDYVAPTEPTVTEPAATEPVATEPTVTEPASGSNTTDSDVLGDNGWENGKVKDSFTVGSNITVSVTATPNGEWGQNSGKFYDSDQTWRIYQNESPAVTVAAGTGKIVSIKVTYETKNDGVLTLNGKNVESGAVVEINAASAVFGVANLGDKTNGQVKITAIEVIHTGAASSEPEATEPEATEPVATEPVATEPVATEPKPENPEFGIIAKPSVSDPFKFGMTQANLENAVYYLKGGMDGYYMATTTDINEAIDVYLEQAEGGYYFYTMVDGTKTYINMIVSGTHVNGAYEATASTVYTIKNGTLVATVEVEGEAAEYWFGTRNDKQYTTMGPCKTSYEGFYGQFYGATNPETGDTFSSIVFALMALSAIGAGVVISKKKEF